MLHSILKVVTDFGDSAVTVPLALLTLIFLVGVGSRRAAFAWLAAILSCAATVGILKLALGACGDRPLSVGLVNPSGHAAMSATVYCSLAVLVGSTRCARDRSALVVFALMISAAIGISRIALRMHSGLDVIVGLAVGLTSAVMFGAVLAAGPVATLSVPQLTTTLWLLVAMMYGTRWPVEGTVRRFGAMIQAAGSVCR
jgi:membrane-associated phospholipid phosphatase